MCLTRSLNCLVEKKHVETAFHHVNLPRLQFAMFTTAGAGVFGGLSELPGAGRGGSHAGHGI